MVSDSGSESVSAFSMWTKSEGAGLGEASLPGVSPLPVLTRSTWSPWPPFTVSVQQDVLTALAFCVLGALSQIPPPHTHTSFLVGSVLAGWLLAPSSC